MFSTHLTEVSKIELLVASRVSHKRYMPLAEIKIMIVLNNVTCELHNDTHINLTIFALVL